jgi:hypothetical protein
MDRIYVNGEEYRLIILRGRGKYITKDGKAINPYKKNQKCTVHYNTDGYPCFGGGIPVHLYIAYGWVDGYFDGAEINHKDFNRKNYNADNLEWVTHKENIDYTAKYNYDKVRKSKTGSNNGRANFTEDEVLLIRDMYTKGNSVANIIRYFYPELKTAKQYKNIHSTFSNIIKRKTWKHI